MDEVGPEGNGPRTHCRRPGVFIVTREMDPTGWGWKRGAGGPAESDQECGCVLAAEFEGQFQCQAFGPAPLEAGDYLEDSASGIGEDIERLPTHQACDSLQFQPGGGEWGSRFEQGIHESSGGGVQPDRWRERQRLPARTVKVATALRLECMPIFTLRRARNLEGGRMDR